MLSKEEQAEKYADIEHYVNCGTSRYQGFLAGYTARDEEDRWVSVETELPPVQIEILCYYNKGITLRYFSLGHKALCAIEWIENIKVTHWQPLPSKPIEK